jgi:ferredoxin
MPQVIDWVKKENRVTNPKAKPPAKAGAAKPAPKPAAAPAAAAKPAAAAAPAATATAPAPTTDRIEPLPNTPENAGKAISVWIEPGCIVCDLCEDTCPEVFHVTAETSVVLPENRLQWPALTENVIRAAEECPVNVIKYTLGG